MTQSPVTSQSSDKSLVRHVTLALMLAQSASAAGFTMVQTVAQLAAVALSGQKLLASLPSTFMLAGAALAAYLAGRIMGRIGRRYGLTLGVAGSTLLTDALGLNERARLQGANDAAVNLASATGSLSSGLLLATVGFALVSAVGFAIALAPLVAAVFILHSSARRLANAR